MSNLERALRAEWRRIRAENTARLAGCSFKLNGRFRTKLGVCRTSRATGLPVSVEVSKHLMAPGLEEQAWDTFYHEVAHALVGHAAGHGREWKAMCVKLGAKPERLASLTSDQRQILSNAQGGPKWTVGCQDCGMQGHRHQLTRAMKQNGRCAKCDGLLWWKDNRTGATGKQRPVPSFLQADADFTNVFTVPAWRR